METNDEKIKLEVERQIDAMKEKPFVVRHKAAKDGLNLAYYVAAVLSIFTGLGLFYEFLLPVMWAFFAAFFSVVFLAFIEAGEGWTAKESFAHFFQTKLRSGLSNGTISAIRWCSFAFMFLLSLAISCGGTYFTYKRYSTIETGIKDAYTLKQDSVKSAHDAHISALAAEAEQYRASNMVKEGDGKTLRYGSVKRYNEMLEALQSARDAKKSELVAVQTSEVTDLLQGKSKNDFSALSMVLWVFLLSATKLVRHWFLNYYAYRVTKEGLGGSLQQTKQESKPVYQIAPAVHQKAFKAPVSEQKAHILPPVADVKQEKAPEIPMQAPESNKKEHDLINTQPVLDIYAELAKILNKDPEKAKTWLDRHGKHLFDKDLNKPPKESFANKVGVSPSTVDNIRRQKAAILDLPNGEKIFEELRALVNQK